MVMPMVMVVVVMIVPVIMRMIVVMVVLIERQRAFGAKAKQRPILGGGGDHARRPFTADMAVQANHPVRGAHHHMQIMADH